MAILRFLKEAIFGRKAFSTANGRVLEGDGNIIGVSSGSVNIDKKKNTPFSELCTHREMTYKYTL